MKSHILRLYLVGVALFAFFVLWAAVAARPWTASSARTKPELDPRLLALNRRERRLQREARVVSRTVDRRWHDYRRRLHVREERIAAARRRYRQALTRARAAAAQQASASTVSAVYSAVAPASSAAQVVTLPPTVKVVTLPPASAPATSSGSSHP